MEIFNVRINGSDAKAFCKLSKEQKKQWILKYTNQKNEVLIEQFLTNPLKTNDCGCGCGGKNGNISKAIPSESQATDENITTSRNSERVVAKRRKNAKTT